MGGIVAIWILVLVPMWLNRHELDDASRSVDSFSAAMRVLSRRGPGAGSRRYVVMPRREDWGLTVDNHPDAQLTRHSSAPGYRPDRQARLIRRRRRTTLALLGVTTALAVAALIGLTSWWFALVLLLVTAGYLVHLRGAAIRARQRRDRRVARTVRARGATDLDEVPPSRRAEPATAETLDAPIGDGVLPAPAVSAAGTENGSRWEPVPVPLPTYVSKPVAQRPASAAPRADVESGTIDLTRPGEWSAVHDPQQRVVLDETGSSRIAASPRVAAAAARTAAEFDDDELDIILERRPAVGD
jgi:hypothetical protein